MKKETILLIVMALVVGVLIGVIFSNAKKDLATSNDQAVTPIAAPSVNYNQQIKSLEAVLAKEPDNRRAWVMLGNSYFDSGNPMKSIEAYDKALELDSNDADVLTDQGVMYRRIGQFDKAIANFIQANKLEPEHANSLINLGVVYSQDLGDKAKAKQTWNRYLELVPTGQEADRVRTMLDHMENGHEQSPGQ